MGEGYISNVEIQLMAAAGGDGGGAGAAGGGDKLEKATACIAALAGWIDRYLGKEGEARGSFITLAGTKSEGYGMEARQEEGDIHVEGQGYLFDVTQYGTTIDIHNGGIRLDSYPGKHTLASAKATLSLRVLLADELQRRRGPPWTVVVKLDDTALVTVRGTPPGTEGRVVATVVGSVATDTIRWSTLSYLLYAKSYYTLQSGDAFQISEQGAEVDILAACDAVRRKLTDREPRTIQDIQDFYDNPTQWHLNQRISRLRETLTDLNTELQTILGDYSPVTYDYKAGESPTTSIHTYFSRSQPGAWSRLPTQTLLF
jgi:hypothetical protein